MKVKAVNGFARILKAEVRAAAAGKLADPKDALLHLDLSAFRGGASPHNSSMRSFLDTGRLGVRARMATMARSFSPGSLSVMCSSAISIEPSR